MAWRVSLLSATPFVWLGEPNLSRAPRSARWLTTLSVCNLTTGRDFATSASLLCSPCPACRADLRPVSERNQELVNSIARVVQPQAGRSETGRCG